MCAFDLFLKSWLSNCISLLLISAYLFCLLLGCLWVALLSPSLDFMCYGGFQYFCSGVGSPFLGSNVLREKSPPNFMEEAKRITEPNEKVSRRGQQWFLLLLLPPLVWGIVFSCYPLVAEEIRPLIVFNLVGGLKPLGPPLYVALVVAFLITILYPRTSQGKSFLSHLRHEEGSERLRQGAIACWVLGYGNLLFGVIPSVIGTIAPFLVGMVLYIARAVRLGERPSWQPRGYILAIGIFLLYDLFTLLWSSNRAISLEWWIREASLLPSIFLLLMYPPHPRDIRVFMHYALRISYLYLLSIVAIYVVVCWATDTSLGAAFGL